MTAREDRPSDAECDAIVRAYWLQFNPGVPIKGAGADEIGLVRAGYAARQSVPRECPHCGKQFEAVP